LGVAATLGIADLLAEGPRSPSDLAAATETQASALYRVLRALASYGVFAEDETGRFALTPLAEPLRAEAPGAVRATLAFIAERWYRVWGELLFSVRSGESAFEHLFGVTS
jgi:DNA-binding IclR family transcriptional regulator